jgi:hypothetical protein
LPKLFPSPINKIQSLKLKAITRSLPGHPTVSPTPHLGFGFPAVYGSGNTLQ